ncbi:hypothetical protein ZOSMA_119G00050 [Zostera marina]|uniref:Uncharacterized protein n=1 Tax=Zostera marina TaxID=29655 RepID=A0A0K9Q1F8_ZOSMR|nr:hypothetical protein ZOSMA_119G00050 [Zostera marina]
MLLTVRSARLLAITRESECPPIYQQKVLTEK